MAYIVQNDPEDNSKRSRSNLLITHASVFQQGKTGGNPSIQSGIKRSHTKLTTDQERY